MTVAGVGVAIEGPAAMALSRLRILKRTFAVRHEMGAKSQQFASTLLGPAPRPAGEEDVILLFDTEHIAHRNRFGVDISGDATPTPCAPL